MKLHRNLTEAVLSALHAIFEENRYADKVLEKILQSNKKWGARDRAFIAENTYEIVRWQRLLRYILQTENSQPPYADSWYWQIFGTWQILQKEQLPNWEEFENLNPTKIFERYESAKSTRKIIQSIPDWLDSLGEQELGASWDSEMAMLNRQAPVVLRVNRLKTNRNDLLALLNKDNIPTKIPTSSLLLPDALLLERRMNVFTSPHFKNGLFEIQDAASQLVAPFLDLKQGLRVVDACAGAGGKTLHLASLLGNTGRIIALDTEAWKLDELKLRARRNGVSNIETRAIDSSKVIKRLHESADRLLLDVPCSGLGVLRRNPDAKWKLQPDFIATIKQTQADILEKYAQILKVGGKMVYATCSILPSESEEQVQLFLEKHKEQYELVQEQRVSPAQTGFDGFYMACLLKK
jgi:16S rRNA (cytosine967-C5)-methyltransferase